MSRDTLLDIKDLSVSFNLGLPEQHGVIRNLSIELNEGETLGLVGESGTGKTVLALSILGLLPRAAVVSSGEVRWKGINLLELKETQQRRIRGKEIAMIFQDPQASLNPVYPVGKQLMWLLKLHRDLRGKAARAEVINLFDAVRLSNPGRCFRSFAHELSGGMAQRVMIAMALACRPRLLIADEPTSALDVTTQAEIIDLIGRLKNEFNMSVLFISHDLPVVSCISDHAVVLYRGAVVETGLAWDVFNRPRHPHTRKLVEASRMPSFEKRNDGNASRG